MNQINYGQRSGIVVDWCKPDGIWLDSGELRNLLEWAKAGGPKLTAGMTDPHISNPPSNDVSDPAPPSNGKRAFIHGKKRSDQHFAIDLLTDLLDFLNHW